MKLYKGNQLIQAATLKSGEILPPYLPEAGLVEAVKVAIALGRPLLVMGEPGCGKSMLAKAVAYELYGEAFRDYFFEWNIKSTSKVKDGFYEYEALRRLLDVQLKDGKAASAQEYIKPRAMTEAIMASTQDAPAILLIDEIDKADLDFPNDLLNELEGGKFIVPETGKPIADSNNKPIIIITSNREKELPEAFLRRCIYFFITPFDKERLIKILKNRFYGESVELDDNTKALLTNTTEAFEKIRKTIKESKVSGKNVSTSELIDWFGVLKKMAAMGNEEKNIESFVKEIAQFVEENTKTLPLQQALFKNFETIELFKK